MTPPKFRAIRNVPDKTWNNLKAYAATHGMKLPEALAKAIEKLTQK